MAFDYAGLREGTVKPLIQNFGDDGVLITAGETHDEPYDSRLNDECEIDIKFVRTSFTEDNNNGTIVEVGDLMLLVSTEGVSIDPDLAQRVIMNCKQYQVVRIDPLKPGSVIMLWKIQVRK